MSISNVTTSHATLNPQSGDSRKFSLADVPFVKTPTEFPHFSPCSPIVRGTELLYKDMHLKEGKQFPMTSSSGDGNHVTPNNKC